MIGVTVSGLAGDGKDTLADLLVAEFGFEKDSMARDLKRIAEEQFGWDKNKDRAGRRLLQVLGTEAGRAYNKRIWIEMLEKRLPKPKLVIPDVRFKNELEFFQDRGFLTVLVVRGNWWERMKRRWFRRASWHQSEREWRDWDFDMVIYNDGDLESFHAQVRKLVGLWILMKEQRG